VKAATITAILDNPSPPLARFAPWPDGSDRRANFKPMALSVKDTFKEREIVKLKRESI